MIRRNGPQSLTTPNLLQVQQHHKYLRSCAGLPSTSGHPGHWRTVPFTPHAGTQRSHPPLQPPTHDQYRPSTSTSTAHHSSSALGPFVSVYIYANIIHQFHIWSIHLFTGSLGILLPSPYLALAHKTHERTLAHSLMTSESTSPASGVHTPNSGRIVSRQRCTLPGREQRVTRFRTAARRHCHEG